MKIAFVISVTAIFNIAGAIPYPGCSAPTESEFKMVTLTTRPASGLNEPLKMSFDMTEAGKVDIYFIEKIGNLRKYDGATQAVTTLGKLNVHVQDEYGLMGIVLDPKFKANRNLYLLYMPNQGAIELRISRFTLAGNTLDMASEKIMIHFPAATGWHGGGGMAFDPAGNLWVGVGDTRVGEGAAPNTNDFRGKILRIHPEADGSYTIPAGNLFPPGTDKTKPEVYIMGNREPYTLAIDPKTSWMVWGEVGPDGFGTTEEYDLATKPYNAGFPYFAGNNKLLTHGDGIHTTPSNEDPAHPTNTSQDNTGLKDLPPAVPGTYSYPQACGITGPVYRYDFIPNSPVKFPPQFDGLWFVGDINKNELDTMALDGAGKPGPLGRLFPTMHVFKPTDFKVGPDGAMYIINYAGNYGPSDQSSIVRIEYTGTCRPEVKPASALRAGRALEARDLSISGSEVAILREGISELRVWDPRGRILFKRVVLGGETIDLAGLMRNRPGVYGVTLAAGGGSLARKWVLLAP
jgi:cytochrome c